CFSQKLREENAELKGRAGAADAEASSWGQARDTCVACDIHCLSTMMFISCFTTPPSYATFVLFVTATSNIQRASLLPDLTEQLRSSSRHVSRDIHVRNTVG
ncbi:unnamed protein product, partial [Ectocarpus sp. 13 AM-2016]